MRIALLLVVSLGCAGSSPPQPTETSPPVLELPSGDFRLNLAAAAPWQRNALSYDAASRAGVVTIDLGIGPEARAPGPDEIVHELRFEAEDTAGLAFQVTVGSLMPVEYRLHLWPCPEAGAPACSGPERLQGTATIGGNTVRATATEVPRP